MGLILKSKRQLASTPLVLLIFRHIHTYPSCCCETEDPNYQISASPACSKMFEKLKNKLHRHKSKGKTDKPAAPVCGSHALNLLIATDADVSLPRPNVNKNETRPQLQRHQRLRSNQPKRNRHRTKHKLNRPKNQMLLQRTDGTWLSNNCPQLNKKS